MATDMDSGMDTDKDMYLSKELHLVPQPHFFAANLSEWMRLAIFLFNSLCFEANILNLTESNQSNYFPQIKMTETLISFDSLDSN